MGRYTHDEISALIRRRRERGLFACEHTEEKPCEHTAEKWPSASQEEGLHRELLAGTLILEFSVSITVKYLLFKTPSMWHFVITNKS